MIKKDQPEFDTILLVLHTTISFRMTIKSTLVQQADSRGRGTGIGVKLGGGCFKPLM